MLQVNPGSKAEEAGLREGDVIDEINGIQPVTLEEAKRLQKISDSGSTIPKPLTTSRALFRFCKEALFDKTKNVRASTFTK